MLRHPQQLGAAQPHPPPATAGRCPQPADFNRQPPVVAGFLRADPDMGGGLVDLEAVRPAARVRPAVRRQQGRTPPPSADALPRRRREQQQRAAADQPQRAAPRDGRRGGPRGDQPGLVGVRRRVGALAQRPHRPRHPQHHMRHERTDEHPRPVEVQPVERPGEDVVQLDVENPRDELEQRAADQQQQRQPLQRMPGGPGRRQREQLRDDRPELGQQHGHQGDAEGDMEALGDPVEPVRARRPGEEIEAEQALVRGLVVDAARQIRVVGGVRQQPGHEQQRDTGQQDDPEQGRQPGAAQRTAPEGRGGRGSRGSEAKGTHAPTVSRARCAKGP